MSITISPIKRQSNLELCRIVSMLLIVLLHSTWVSVGYPGNIGFPNILLIAFYSLSIVAVDVFLLISGWFSINVKKSSVINLLWICLFYGLIRLVYHYYTGNLSVDSFLFVSKSNWFVVSYIGLMIVSPVLNIFANGTSKKLLGTIIILILIYSFWFNVFPARVSISPGFNNGCSLIWFIEVYLIGRYLRIYGIRNILLKFGIYIYVLLSCLIFIFVIIAVLYVPSEKMSVVVGLIGAQNNPVVLLSAIALFVTFCNIHIQSITINHVAKSSLAVLIVHGTIITKYMKEYFQWLYGYSNDIYLFNLAVLWLGGVLIIYLIAVVVDQLRLFLYGFIKK